MNNKNTCKPVIKRMADIEVFVDDYLSSHKKANSKQMVRAMKKDNKIVLKWLNDPNEDRACRSFARRLTGACSHICTNVTDTRGNTYWEHV
jgi:hypothetical protein